MGKSPGKDEALTSVDVAYRKMGGNQFGGDSQKRLDTLPSGGGPSCDAGNEGGSTGGGSASGHFGRGGAVAHAGPGILGGLVGGATDEDPGGSGPPLGLRRIRKAAPQLATTGAGAVALTLQARPGFAIGAVIG